MRVARDTVVVIHYTLTDNSGAELESSTGGEPMAYLHGSGQLIVGLEEALEGRREGEKFSVAVPAEKAYGPRDATRVRQLPKRAIRGVAEVRAGMRVTLPTPQGPQPVLVTRVAGDMVTVDGNHPLAGQALAFEVEILSVRAASADELAHGHVHGSGGAHD